MRYPRACLHQCCRFRGLSVARAVPGRRVVAVVELETVEMSVADVTEKALMIIGLAAVITTIGLSVLALTAWLML